MERRAATSPAGRGRERLSVAPSIVARVLAERAEGRSYAAIAAGLMDEGIPAPGVAAHWYPGTVRTIEQRAGDGASA